MGLRIEALELPDVLHLTRDIWRDARGAFSESWQRDRYVDVGLPTEWAQDNVSHSTRHVLRGLHFQWPQPQGKLVSILSGTILDVAVDIRHDSPSFGLAATLELDAETGSQLYVPAGFAHGFLVLSHEAIVHYKCTALYAPGCESTLLWNDPVVGVPWPDIVPLLSPKDADGRALASFSMDELPSLEKLR